MFITFGKWLIGFFAWLDLFLATLFLYLLSFLPKKLSHRWYLALFKGWCWIFIRALGVELKIIQKNLHPLPKHAIIIGNHPSVLEDLGMHALFNARFLAKAEIKDWWIFGRLSNAIGTLYVKRESKDSRRHAIEEIIHNLKAGENIGLYPEGGCKGRRLYLPFQFGAFDAAIQTQVPIIPVFLYYEAQEDFEWKEEETLLQKLWKIAISRNKRANYYVFDAIDPAQFETKEALTNYVQTLYLQWQAKYLE